MRLLCTFSQTKNFVAGKEYESEVVRRCGMDFNEVKGESGFPVCLQPGDSARDVSAFSGHKLLADFQPVGEEI